MNENKFISKENKALIWNLLLDNLVFNDIDNDDSYKNLKVWLELCKTTCPNESVVIFGNKADKLQNSSDLKIISLQGLVPKL